jgi:serine/threonine-protein kinase HipA
MVGQLILDDGRMVFEYTDSWLKNPNSVSLSHSLPLQKERFDRKICRGFFAGILPEESKRTMVAQNLGISKTNDFSMLEHITNYPNNWNKYYIANSSLKCQMAFTNLF